jgi:hypothetical protein
MLPAHNQIAVFYPVVVRQKVSAFKFKFNPHPVWANLFRTAGAGLWSGARLFVLPGTGLSGKGRFPSLLKSLGLVNGTVFEVVVGMVFAK